MEVTSAHAYKLIEPYSKEEKLELLRLWKSTPFGMLEILNAWVCCDKNFNNTDLVLRTAAQLGLHPADITNLFFIHTKHTPLMNTLAKTPTGARVNAEADKLKFQEAEMDVKRYLDLQAEKSAIDTKMKGYKTKLLAYAEDNRSKFDESGNLQFESGYLHFGSKSVVKTSPKFDLLRFVKFFPELLKREFKVAAIKAMLADQRGKVKLKPHGISITEVEEFSVVPKKKVDE